jgi:hypothetical protein
MDAKNINAGPTSKLPNGLQLSGGKLTGGQRMMVDLVICLPGGGAPTKNLDPDCKQKADAAALMVYFYEKTVNVKFYEEPLTYNHRQIDRVIPANELRFGAELTLSWIDLYTDVGLLTKDLKHDPIVSVQNYRNRTDEKTLNNIPKNYGSQGKIIMADFAWHLEISTTNDKTEIYRYYFSIIDVFSAVGGL